MAKTTTKRTRRSEQRETGITLMEAMGLDWDHVAVTKDARGDTVGVYGSGAHVWASRGWETQGFDNPAGAAAWLHVDPQAHVWQRRDDII